MTRLSDRPLPERPRGRRSSTPLITAPRAAVVCCLAMFFLATGLIVSAGPAAAQSYDDRYSDSRGLPADEPIVIDPRARDSRRPVWVDPNGAVPVSPVDEGARERALRERERARRRANDGAYDRDVFVEERQPRRLAPRPATPAYNDAYDDTYDNRYDDGRREYVDDLPGQPYEPAPEQAGRPTEPNPDYGARPVATDDPTYTVGEITDAGHSFFGSISKGLAQAIEYAFQRGGRPNGYILGQEAGGAFIAGLRYGEGQLYTKNAGVHPVYWQGPTVGYDFGGEGARVMVLVYDLPSVDYLYRRFAGVGGSAYLIGGVGVTFHAHERVKLAPIRAGVGLRLGANVGYLKLTRRPTWNPF